MYSGNLWPGKNQGLTMEVYDLKNVKRSMFILVTLLAILCLSAVTQAAEVALTSVGQSPDAMMVMVVLKKMQIETDFDALMKPGDLKDQKVLIAVVGGSSKGLGAAGINSEQEKERSTSLLAKAKDAGVKILVMHVGGEGRRGTLSDLFIEAVVPFADRITIVKGGNHDGLFDTLKSEETPLAEVETIRAIDAPLNRDLSDWGIL
jgi:hypothetical protein